MCEAGSAPHLPARSVRRGPPLLPLPPMAALSLNAGQDRKILLRTSSDSVVHLNVLENQKAVVPDLDRRSLGASFKPRGAAVPYGASRSTVSTPNPGARPAGPLTLGKFTLSAVNLASTRGFSRSAAGLQWSETIPPPSQQTWSPFQTEYTSKFAAPPPFYVNQKATRNNAPPIHPAPQSSPLRTPFQPSPHGVPLDFGHSYFDNAVGNAALNSRLMSQP